MYSNIYNDTILIKIINPSKELLEGIHSIYLYYNNKADFNFEISQKEVWDGNKLIRYYEIIDKQNWLTEANSTIYHMYSSPVPDYLLCKFNLFQAYPRVDPHFKRMLRVRWQISQIKLKGNNHR